jgi:hypothetical protein
LTEKFYDRKMGVVIGQLAVVSGQLFVVCCLLFVTAAGRGGVCLTVSRRSLLKKGTGTTTSSGWVCGKIQPVAGFAKIRAAAEIGELVCGNQLSACNWEIAAEQQLTDLNRCVVVLRCAGNRLRHSLKHAQPDFKSLTATGGVQRCPLLKIQERFFHVALGATRKFNLVFHAYDRTH